MELKGAGSHGLEWGVAGTPRPGETESGDHYIVRVVPGGLVVAVIDGVGHGEPAFSASRRAAAAIEADPARTVIAHMRRSHEAVIGTRGVVMSLAAFNTNEDTMTWLGVGNVFGILVRSDPRAVPHREEMLTRGGVVGLHLPLLQASVSSLQPGDIVALATDGVRPDFGDQLTDRVPPTVLASQILAEHGRGTDDSLVFVGRYCGTPGAS